MEIVFTGITATAADRGEYDKFIRVVTPQGVRHCIVKGVKKPSAKLKAAAMPFAFYEFSGVVQRGSDFVVVTGAAQIEDLFVLTSNCDKHWAASTMLEASLFCFLEQSEEFFVYLLHRLKDIIYGENSPYLPPIRFFQHVIHSSGYGYDYPDFAAEPTTSLQLLAALSRLKPQQSATIFAPEPLIKSTLKKIIASFEQKFEADLNSKKLIF